MPRLCALARVELCTHDASPTGEHVIPNAINKRVFGNAGPYWRFRNGQLDKPVDGNLMPEAVKLPMCEHHNDVLNRRFEQRWQELIIGLAQGSRVEMHSADLEGVAGWIAKTVLMFALMDDARPRPADEYEHVLATGRPPNHWSVWITSLATHAMTTLHGEYGRDPGPFDFHDDDNPIVFQSDDGPRIFLPVTGFAVCRSLGHLLYVAGTNGHGPPLLSPAEHVGVVHRCWPHPEPLSWPGPLLLNEVGMRRLASQYMQ
jgi:hypothetical protein